MLRGASSLLTLPRSVWQDHATYEKNKSKAIIESIEFSSIEKPDTARYIFEFINFLRHRSINNNVCTYSKYQDIEDALRKQWSGLFQRLLFEQRTKQLDTRRIDALSEQFEDLKAAILTSLGTKNERDVARGVVKFRRFFDFIRGFDLPSYSFVLNEHHTWDEFLSHLDIVDIKDAERDSRVLGPRPFQFLIKRDGTFYEVRFPIRLPDLRLDWDAFMMLEPTTRTIIFDALNDLRVQPPNRFVRYIARTLEEHLAETEKEPQVTAVVAG